MWTASRRPRTAARHESGFTLMETAIVIATLGSLSLLVERTIAAVHDADTTLTTYSRVQERCDRVAYEVYRSVRSSRRLFVRGTTGDAYLQSLDVRRFLPAPGTRLPLPDELDPLGPDLADEPRTGNAVLFVREGDPVACPLNPLTNSVRYVDVYRFTCIYPHEASPRRLMQREGRDSRDLILWESVPFANHAQIVAITDATQRARVVAALRDTWGIHHAWDANAPVGSAFYALGAAGTLATTPESEFLIEEDLAASPGSRLVYANFQLARTSPDSHDRRALLSVEDAEAWVPDGFEVKVVGASGARKVWLNLVVEGQSSTLREAVAKTTLVVNLRDL